MFTNHDAIALLLARRPDLTQAEINAWYIKGADAILAYLNSLDEPTTQEAQLASQETQAEPVADEPQPKPKTRKSHATES